MLQSREPAADLHGGRGIGEVGKENSGLLKLEASLFRPAGWLMLLFAGVRGSHT